MPIYSYSRLETYKTCPRQYFYYYLKAKTRHRKMDIIFFFLGSRAHETLRKIYDDLNMGKENTIHDLLRFYNCRWKQNWHDKVIILDKEYTPENYRKVGRDAIIKYFNRYKPFTQAKWTTCEKKLTFELDSYRIQTYLDRLDKIKEGIYEIHDYKTSKERPTSKQLALLWQSPLYEMAVRANYPDAKEVKLIWHYLRHDEEVIPKKALTDLTELRKSVVSLIKEIETKDTAQEDQFKPIEKPHCQWCAYWDICPRKKHSYKIDGLPTKQFLADKGIKLANKYLKYTRIKREAQGHLGVLRDYIIKYSRKENLEVIWGSNGKILIISKDEIKFPKKGDPQREKLEKIIKDSKEALEVLTLDSKKLAILVKKEALSKELLKKIKKYQTAKKSYLIRPSRLKVFRYNE